MAFLMPAASPQPSPESSTANVTGWVAHSNLGVGNKLRDYFVRVYAKTDIEYLQEDNIPIIVQDSTHARFGTSRVIDPGTPVAHVIYNDPQLGEVDLYSTLQNLAVYSDLPRSIEVPPGDPDYASPGLITSSNLAYIQNRCWIYDAALAIIAFSVAGLWDAAERIVTRLNALRDDPGYLPSLVLENAEDGSTTRWSLESGAGSIANLFDSTEPPNGSKVISFTATAAPPPGALRARGCPTRSIPSSNGATRRMRRTSSSSASRVRRPQSLPSNSSPRARRGTTPFRKPSRSSSASRRIPGASLSENLNTLIGQYVSGETLVSIDAFQRRPSSRGQSAPR